MKIVIWLVESINLSVTTSPNSSQVIAFWNKKTDETQTNSFQMLDKNKEWLHWVIKSTFQGVFGRCKEITHNVGFIFK